MHPTEYPTIDQVKNEHIHSSQETVFYTSGIQLFAVGEYATLTQNIKGKKKEKKEHSRSVGRWM